MAARIVFCLMIIAFLPALINAAPEAVTDSRVTAEVILDGMTHFDADQGLKDYKVSILEATRETGKPEASQREKVLYFLAPNNYLTKFKDEPPKLRNDDTFMISLDKNDLTRDKDVMIRDEQCFKVIATPKDPFFKKFKTTYFVSKADFRKIRIENMVQEVQFGLIRYETDYFYEEYKDNENSWVLLERAETKGYDTKEDIVVEQSNDYSNYEFNIGLKKSFFENIKYNPGFSEGT